MIGVSEIARVGILKLSFSAPYAESNATKITISDSEKEKIWKKATAIEKSMWHGMVPGPPIIEARVVKILTEEGKINANHN